MKRENFIELYRSIYEDLYVTAFYLVKNKDCLHQVLNKTIAELYISKTSNMDRFRVKAYKKLIDNIEEHADNGEGVNMFFWQYSTEIKNKIDVLEKKERLYLVLSVFSRLDGTSIKKISKYSGNIEDIFMKIDESVESILIKTGKMSAEERYTPEYINRYFTDIRLRKYRVKRYIRFTKVALCMIVLFVIIFLFENRRAMIDIPNNMNQTNSNITYTTYASENSNNVGVIASVDSEFIYKKAIVDAYNNMESEISSSVLIDDMDKRSVDTPITDKYGRLYNVDRFCTVVIYEGDKKLYTVDLGDELPQDNEFEYSMDASVYQSNLFVVEDKMYVIWSVYNGSISDEHTGSVVDVYKISEDEAPQYECSFTQSGYIVDIEERDGILYVESQNSLAELMDYNGDINKDYNPMAAGKYIPYEKIYYSNGGGIFAIDIFATYDLEKDYELIDAFALVGGMGNRIVEDDAIYIICPIKSASVYKVMEDDTYKTAVGMISCNHGKYSLEESYYVKGLIDANSIVKVDGRYVGISIGRDCSAIKDDDIKYTLLYMDFTQEAKEDIIYETTCGEYNEIAMKFGERLILRIGGNYSDEEQIIVSLTGDNECAELSEDNYIKDELIYMRLKDNVYACMLGYYAMGDAQYGSNSVYFDIIDISDVNNIKKVTTYEVTANELEDDTANAIVSVYTDVEYNYIILDVQKIQQRYSVDENIVRYVCRYDESYNIEIVNTIDYGENDNYSYIYGYSYDIKDIAYVMNDEKVMIQSNIHGSLSIYNRHTYEVEKVIE